MFSDWQTRVRLLRRPTNQGLKARYEFFSLINYEAQPQTNARKNSEILR